MLTNFINELLNAISKSKRSLNTKNTMAKELLCDGVEAVLESLVKCSSVTIWYLLHKFARSLRSRDSVVSDALRQDLTHNVESAMQALQDHYFQISFTHPVHWVLKFIGNRSSSLLQSVKGREHTIVSVFRDWKDCIDTVENPLLLRLATAVIDRTRKDALAVAVTLLQRSSHFYGRNLSIGNSVGGLLDGNSSTSSFDAETVSYLRLFLSFGIPLEMLNSERCLAEYFALLSHQVTASSQGSESPYMFTVIVEGTIHPCPFVRSYSRRRFHTALSVTEFVNSYWKRTCLAALRGNVQQSDNHFDHHGSSITSDDEDLRFDFLWKDALCRLGKVCSSSSNCRPDNFEESWLALTMDFLYTLVNLERRQENATLGKLSSGLPASLLSSLQTPHATKKGSTGSLHAGTSPASLRCIITDTLRLLAELLSPCFLLG
eukprot:gb/GECG01014340.1/.p1 GENE.gb/GECG01014340.1/~~gb/GECG01014340.1/.p1  ORF type:complete len:433 (+),score=29.04 gb/GECG01014340.1/:1-1299(+)